MKVWKSTVLGVCALVGGGACGDDGDTTHHDDGVATVSGRLEASAEGEGATNVVLYRVDDDGALTALGSATLAADGRFAITHAAQGDGPFLVRAEAGADVVAAVIVPNDLGPGDADEDVTTAPLGSETTVEAEALLSILAGSADTDDVDTVALMTWIDARIAAAAADGDDAASLGAAAGAAFEAWLAVTDQASADAVEHASLAAYGELAVRLDAAATNEAASDAYDTFYTDVSAALDATLGISYEAQADAAAAAGFVYEAALAGDAALHFQATRLAAVVSAHADLAAQRDAVAGSSAAADVRAALDVAYDAWFDAAAAADDEQDLDAAFADLTSAIHGSGTLTADSALGILVGAEADGMDGELDDAVAAIGATADASAELRAKLDTALSGEASARASLVAEAYADYAADVAATIDARTELSATVRALAEESASQLGGHGSAILDLDVDALFDGFVTLGSVDLAGAVAAGLGFQSGADGAYGDGAFDALADATTAVLLSIGADGTVTEVDEGAVDAGGYVFEGVASASGTLVVALREASGAITGAVVLDGDTAGGTAPEPPVLTQETTVEALVTLAMAAEGETLDRGVLALLVDAAVAASTRYDAQGGGDDIDTLALAVATATEVRARLLDANGDALARASASAVAELHAELETRGDAAATSFADFRADLEAAVRGASGASEEAYARAWTEASLAFDAVIDARTDAGDALAGAARARLWLESALALDSATDATFEGSAFASAQAQIDAAVTVLVDATESASSGAQVEAAAETFVTTIIGAGSGVGAGGLLGDLGLSLAAEAALDAVFDASFAAAATYQATLEGAVAGGSADGIAELAASASATFDAAIDLSATLLDGADARAMTTLVTQLSLGFQDAADGM